MSLRLRLLLVMLSVYLGGGYLLTRWMLDQIRPRYLESMEESLVDTSVLLASLLEAGASSAGPDIAGIKDAFERAGRRGFEARVFSLSKTAMDLRVYVVNAQGHVLFDSTGPAEGQDFSRWNDVARTLAGRYGARSTRDVPGDDATQVLYVAAPLHHEGRIVGAVTVGKPTLGINALVTVAKRKLWIGAAVGGVALLAVLLLVASWIIAPLERLTIYARAIRDGKAASLPRLPGRTLAELGQAFEQMRDALAGRQHAERYTRALAHEIKAPLTAIRGASELLDEEMPPAQRHQFLANIRRESERIQRVVERLLELSSLESRKTLGQTETILLSELIAEAADAMGSVFDVKDVTLVVKSEAGGSCRGERFLLRQALINLLQNAADFSPPGSEVGLSVNTVADRVIFKVEDRGPGIPPYALAQVFERFYSLPRPGSTQKSTGIGLALVREIAHLHGGNAAIANRAEGGAEATFWMTASLE